MDKENLEFHVEVDDLFATKATVLNLIRQDLDNQACFSIGSSSS